MVSKVAIYVYINIPDVCSVYLHVYLEMSLGRVGMYFCEHYLLVFVHRIVVLSNR